MQFDGPSIERSTYDKASQTKLNRMIALKMIRSGEFASEQEVARFYREAEAAAKLDHPQIVPSPD